MGNKLNFEIPARQIADAFDLKLLGDDLPVGFVCSFNEVKAGGLSFYKNPLEEFHGGGAVVIAPPGSTVLNGCILESDNPRLLFAKAISYIDSIVGFAEDCSPPLIDETAIICPTAVIGRGAVIGPRTTIGSNVVVSAGVKIGADCVIKSNTVIGEPGFGFERDGNGIPIRLLHLGSVVIGDRVELGSLNTVCRATLGMTIIEDDVKTDDHVHIAHNCVVRKGALITACVELSGGVDVGEYSWIGPNTSVIQKAVLGRGSFIGIGANVLKSVPEMTTVAGNPAKVIRKMSDG